MKRDPLNVFVKVSTALLAEVGEWSEPVQVKVVRQPDDTFELVFKTPKYDVRAVNEDG